MSNIRHELLSALDAMSDAFALFDKDDRLVVWNNAFAKIHKGMRRKIRAGVGFEALLRARIEAGLRPDAREREEAWLADRMAQHRNPKGPIVVTSQGGRHLIVTEYRRSDGATIYIARDETDRVESDKALRESEERLRLAVRAGNVGLWDWDLTTDRVYYSPEWKRQIGYEEHEIGDGYDEWASRVHADDLAATLEKVRAHIENRTPDYKVEFRLRHKDGSYRWILAEGSKTENAKTGEARLLGSHIDITERKRMLESVQEKDERLRATFLTASDGLVFIDDNRQVIDANQSFADMLGYTLEEVLTLYPWDWDELHPTKESHFETWPELARTPLVFSAKMRRKDGTVFHAQVSVSPVEFGGRRVVFCVVRDMSDSRRQEAELLQARKMEAVGQLTGGIAHDFNNLMTVIMGNLRLLYETLGDAQDEDTSGLIQDALSAARDGAELTDRLLAFSRKQSLMPKRINMNDFLADFARFLNRTLGANTQLELRPASNVWAVFADPGQFQTALLNLAINARDAMDGKGLLTIDTRNRSIGLEGSGRLWDVAPGDYVEILLSDTGPGMSPEVMDRAFEPFFTTRKSGHGTGLGLSMVYGFAKQSGGTAAIDSKPGRGTTVSILLPRARRERAAKVAAKPRRDLPKGTETILVVEDEARVRRFAVRCLQGLGYRVLQAENADAALDILEGGDAVDLLFSDIIMPGRMDGRELAATVGKRYPGVKVLLASGYSGGLRSEAATGRPWRATLKKPYTKEQLAVRIREMLDKPKSRRAKAPEANSVPGGAQRATTRTTGKGRGHGRE